MTGGELLLAARRRAGLSQEALAERLGKPQSTVSRWEQGAMDPGFSTLSAAIRACELELDVSLARADDSYLPLIRQQLRRRPIARLINAAGPHFKALLTSLVESEARFLLAGSHAAAAHGSPVSPSPRTVLVPDDDPVNLERLQAALERRGARAVPADRDGDIAFELADRTAVLLQTKAPGTGGFRDLVRDAESMPLNGKRVAVVSALDLLRIADASGDPEDRLLRPALQKVLEVRRAHDRDTR